jgi:hypothetical protein
MRGKLGDKVRLQHIFDAIVEIETYTVHKEFSDFLANSMMRFACIKQMEIRSQLVQFQSNIGHRPSEIVQSLRF